MGLGERAWDALKNVIRMNEKITAVSAELKAQQQKIEDLTARVIRLETALEIALASRGRKALSRKEE